MSLMLINPYDASLDASMRLPAPARLITQALQSVQSTRPVGLEELEELAGILTRWSKGQNPTRRNLAPILQRSMLILQRAVPASAAVDRPALRALQGALMEHGPAILRSCDASLQPRIQQRQSPRAEPAPWWFRWGAKLLPCTSWLDANAPGRSLCLAGLSLWRQHRAAR